MNLVRTSRFLVLGVLLGLVGLVSAACAEEDTPSTANPFPERERMLVIHSYDDGFRWTAELGEGFVDGLEDAGMSYDLDVFFMDTRVRYTTAEQVAERAEEALALIEESEPALVFVTDDVALREVAVRFVEEHPDTDTAFVFAGINVDPSEYEPIASLEAPGGRITGLLERIPIDNAMTVAKRVFPDAATVALLADGSPSSEVVIADFDATHPVGLDGPIEIESFGQATTFAEWQQRITEANADADLIGLLNYHGLTGEGGAAVSPAEVLEWTLEHATKPVIGLIADLARDGLPMAVGNSGQLNGEAAAEIAVDILEGRDPGEIAIVNAQLTETAFNLEAIEELGLEISESEIAEAGLVIR